VLQVVGIFPSGESADIVSRLKVLAELLTYRSDVPQEGRIREVTKSVEMRVSTYPTLHGERAVVRLFAADTEFKYLDDLGFSDHIGVQLQELLTNTSGVLIVTGPAGSGKTTTAYACLRELVRQSNRGKCLVTLEDPIEVAIDGVSQSQVNANAGFDLATGLRSLMRQDPEAILIGEIRDRPTAETAFQAALTGHLVITTFHAGSAAVAVSRLSDMGIEPYLLRTGTLAIISQRLLRRLCECARDVDDPDHLLGLSVSHAREAVGCGRCRYTGYRGRFIVNELLKVRDSDLARRIVEGCDAATLQQYATNNGLEPCWQQAIQAIEAGRTSPSEFRRVFGLVVQ
jgi:type II secretory ATPase GspE/PulE/Tfp pilus assembly ATPase PilB-like protein